MPPTKAERRRALRERRSAEQVPLRASEDELYLMSNLHPEDTGLPMVVWLSHRGRARHDARAKVQQSHGSRAAPYDTVPIAVRPEPAVVAGQLPAADLRVVSDWIKLNQTVIIDYWERAIGTLELAVRRADAGGLIGRPTRRAELGVHRLPAKSSMRRAHGG